MVCTREHRSRPTVFGSSTDDRCLLRSVMDYWNMDGDGEAIGRRAYRFRGKFPLFPNR